MRRFVWHLVVGVLALALLAACGSDDDKGGSSSPKIVPMEQVSAPQIVGRWMNDHGEIIELYPDGSISGYTTQDYVDDVLREFVAETFTLAEADDYTLLVLNSANGSVHPHDYALMNIQGCDDQAFVMEQRVGQGGRRRHLISRLWYLGEENFEPLRTSELTAHRWRLDDLPESFMEFQGMGSLIARRGDESLQGTWELENNQLHTALLDGSADDIATITHVARCNGQAVIIVIHSESDGYDAILSHPDLIPTTD